MGLKKNAILKGEKSTYTVERQFKSGGNATIYLAKNDKEEFVAIKYLDKLENDKEERFLKELEFQKNAKNTNIVKISDNGEYIEGQNTHYFYVMRFYSQNLRDLINKPLNPKKFIKYFNQMCSAIRYAHKKGVIHRDIKPENVLYDTKGDKVLLADFGIAKFFDENLTKENQRLANFDYHAPEQMVNSKGKIGTYTDIYALGLILNEMFTKIVPYGLGYKKIWEVYPSYASLDDLVDSMIQHATQKREKDVSRVINLLAIHVKRIEEENDNIKALLFDKKPSRVSSRSYKVAESVILEDVSLANKLLNDPDTDWNSIECNYHMNYSFKTLQMTINLAIQLSILDEIKSKFNYESAGYNENNKESRLDLTKEKDNAIYEKILGKIKTFPLANQFLYITDQIMNYVQSLKDYRAEQFCMHIDESIKCAKYNLTDAPLLWISYYLVTVVKESSGGFNYRNPFRIQEHVTINWERFKKDIEAPSYLYIGPPRYQETENMIFNELNKNNIKYTTERIGDGFNFIFNNEKEYEKFKKLLKTFVSKFDKNDIIYRDIDDLLIIDHTYDSTIVLSIDEFYFYTILEKVFKVKEPHIKNN